jgi:hypothetical protein
MSRPIKDYTDIRDTEQQYDFERKEYVVRNVLWVGMVLFLAAGLLGVFGKGVLSLTRVDGAGYYLEYERFLRDETPSSFSLYVQEKSEAPIRLAISRTYLEEVRIQNVIPQPKSAESRDDWIIYTFNASENGLITVNFTPQNVGETPLEIVFMGDQKIVNQYVIF